MVWLGGFIYLFLCQQSIIRRSPMLTLELPTFDLHTVEEALKTNHRMFGGTPMTEEEIHTSIEKYRRFLAEHKAAGAPEKFDFPGYEIDRVWHTHMCETKQYREDCMSYFGKIFEHSNGTCDNPSGR